MMPQSALVHPLNCRIVVRGYVSEGLARRLGLRATEEGPLRLQLGPPVYVMTGLVHDQSALRGIVNHLDDCGMEILAFRSQAAVSLGEYLDDVTA